MNNWNISTFLSESEIEAKLLKIRQYNEVIISLLEKVKINYNKNNVDCILSSYQEMCILIDEIYIFYSHQYDVDMSNSEISDKKNKFISFYQEINISLSNFDEIFLELEHSNNISSQYKDTEYNQFIEEIIRFKNHTFSKREEQLIALSSKQKSSSYNTYAILTATEMQFEDVIDSNKKIHKFDENKWSINCMSNDRKLRESSFKSLMQCYRRYNKTLTQLLLSHIISLSVSTKQRNYSSILKSSLFKNAIDEEIYIQLVNGVNKNIKINHSYMSLRKKILQINELHLYDVYAPLFTKENIKYSYFDSVSHVKKALHMMPKKYQVIASEILDGDYIDVYPKENKRSGAYSGGCYTSKPYILLNHTDTLNDVFTIAHELGHSVHSYLSNETQTYFNSGYKIFVAEVASIVNEFLLLDHFINITTNEKEKLNILNYKLEMFRTTLIRQTMFAEFEKYICEIYEQESTFNYEQINNHYYTLSKKYFGEDVIIDEEIKYEWSRIDHFYYNFYVYQYATSFCVANVVAQKIINKDEEILEKYMNFLKSGCSKNANELVLELSINLSTSQIYDQTFMDYENTINEIKQLWSNNA